jgi:hypothetical protein
MLLPGLKHGIVPPDVDNEKVNHQVEQFINKLQWKYIFLDKPNDDFNPVLFNALKNAKLQPPTRAVPSSFYFPSSHPLRIISRQFNTAIAEFTQLHPANASSGSSLRKYQDITKDFPAQVFIPADKNLGLVCLDVIEYDTMVRKHLHDNNTYKLLTTNDRLLKPYYWKALIIRISDQIIRYRNNIPPSEISFLQKFKNKLEYSIPKFHVLVKLHKWKDLTLAKPSRPIAGAIDWITTHISKLLTIYLQDAMKSHTQVLKNSQQLTLALSNIPRYTNTSTSRLLVTMDVDSLYPSINLNTLYNIVLKDFPPYIIAMARFIFDNSLVAYSNEVYHQINGIAMGTNAAVIIANLYMAKLIDPILLSNHRITSYSRFIDDLFFIYEGDQQELETFVATLQTATPGLTFTFEHSPQSVEFLDLKIYFLDYNLEYQLHQKALNKYAYISPTSCHPLATIKGFIKGELIRINRNSSLRITYLIHTELFFIRLLRRGYSFKILRPIFRREYIDPRLLIPKESTTIILPLVLPYTKRKEFEQIKTIVNKFNPLFAQFIPNSKALVAYSQVASISSTLVQSSLTEANLQVIRNSPVNQN